MTYITHADAGRARTTLGRNIRACMDFVPWTMRDLAEHSKVSLRTLSAWTNHAKRKPKLSYVKSVADALSQATGRRITHLDLLNEHFDIVSAPKLSA